MGDNEELEHASNIQKNLEDIIGAGTVLKKRKKSQDEYKKELFTAIINNLEGLDIRNGMMDNEIGVNFDNYNEPYEQVIQDLFTFTFGVDVSKLIYFYIYQRFNQDGTINQIYDNGKLITLNHPIDLYNLILEIEKKETKKFH